MTNKSKDLEIAQEIQQLLIDRAISKNFTSDIRNHKNNRYITKREELLNRGINHKLPEIVKQYRDLDHFNLFICRIGNNFKKKEYIYDQFKDFLDFIEFKKSTPHELLIDNILKKFDYDSIKNAWSISLERKNHDPEGAITLSRTILESVCKHILDDLTIDYNNNMELHELYKKAAEALNLSPSQHNEQIFKQILGGCSGIINGLGTLRNKFGDAHGNGKKQFKPSARHAELSINLAGSMSLFLLETLKAKKAS